jgi:beta-propeller repeat-containing protein
MRRLHSAAAVVAGTLVALLLAIGHTVGGPEASRAALKTSFAKLPLSFVVNRGQFDRPVAFAVQGRDASALFTPRGVTYVLGGRYAVKVDFVGARATEPVGGHRLAGIVSVFRGHRPDWRTGIPTYGRIAYRNLWPGIDLVWSGSNSRLKYTLLVNPGADPSAIELRYRGGTLSLRGGALVVHTPAETLREGRPVGSAPLAYSLHGNLVGFRVGAYDRSHILRIDPPAILYAGFLGGGRDDFGNAIAVDRSGSAYVTGYTYSAAATFPATAGALDQSNTGGAPDAFVAKVNKAGNALVYAGFLGGSGDEVAHGIAVDAAGSAYVTGSTDSKAATFPNTPFALGQAENGGSDDAFVAKVNPAGTALVYAGFLGGSGRDVGEAIAVDGSGNAYVTGVTVSAAATFPDTAGALDQSDNAGGDDAFVAKVNAAGSALVYAGFLGGSGDETGYGIAVDGSGRAFVTGSTTSHGATFPDTTGALDYSGNAGGTDAFVAEVNAAGSALVYAGFLGGSGEDVGSGIAVGPSGMAYVVGSTRSTAATFPSTPGALDQSNNAGGFDDAFVAKVAGDGSHLVYAGFLGGSGDDHGNAIALGSSGRVFVTGSTDSSAATFPNTPGALGQPQNAGGGDAFVAEVNKAGNALVFAGFLGGGGVDAGNGIAVGPSGRVFVTGSTTSAAATFPDTPGALDQAKKAGGRDAFVAKVGGT